MVLALYFLGYPISKIKFFYTLQEEYETTQGQPAFHISSERTFNFPVVQLHQRGSIVRYFILFSFFYIFLFQDFLRDCPARFQWNESDFHYKYRYLDINAVQICFLTGIQGSL